MLMQEKSSPFLKFIHQNIQSRHVAMKRIAVIGGAGADIKASSRNPIKAGTSNIGDVTVSCGGAAFNIARNLALLDNAVFFITALGEDFFSSLIEDECRRTGVNLLAHKSSNSTGVYTAITDSDGELAAGISAMDIFEELTPEIIDEKLSGTDKISLYVCDTNINSRLLTHICSKSHKTGVPVLIDPTSVDKCERIKDIMGLISWISPDKDELLTLSGNIFPNDMEQSAKTLLEKGPKSIITTLGKDGAFYMDKKCLFKSPAIPTVPVDVTGAGDAFVAAFINQIIKGNNPEDSLKYGCSAAFLTISISDSVNPDITEKLIKKYKEDFY